MNCETRGNSMSKNSFSRFRSRHANHNLNELYTHAQTGPIPTADQLRTDLQSMTKLASTKKAVATMNTYLDAAHRSTQNASTVNLARDR